MPVKSFFLELLFPRFCFNCQREGSYLCEDCLALINFLPLTLPFPKRKNIDGLVCAVPYNNFIVKKLLAQFKYKPFVKDLAKTLADLIIHNLKENLLISGDFVVPIPLAKKRLKERGFNQSEELAKHLALYWKIPLANNVLFKIKETRPQTELSKKQREQNVKGVFLCKNAERIKDKKVVLVDDVYTTGSTMEEVAKVLKSAGAKQVLGVALARE